MAHSPASGPEAQLSPCAPVPPCRGSPLSQKLTFEQLRRGAGLDLAACLQMENRMVSGGCRQPALLPLPLVAGLLLTCCLPRILPHAPPLLWLPVRCPPPHCTPLNPCRV